jgi:hypothetical protein
VARAEERATEGFRVANFIVHEGYYAPSIYFLININKVAIKPVKEELPSLTGFICFNSGIPES